MRSEENGERPKIQGWGELSESLAQVDKSFALLDQGNVV